MARMRAAPLVVCLLALTSVAAAQGPPRPTGPRPDNIRVFLDCSYYCDESYIKREMTFVDYMRDRRDADVHVLMTTQRTGGGGTEYTVKFIGLGPFAGVEQVLRYHAPQTATSDETRRGILEVLKVGLVRYVSESPVASRLKVTLADATKTAQADPKKDPWNLWVFRANVGGSFNGEQATNSHSLRGAASANRTTDAWKLSFSTNTNYSKNSYDLGDGEIYTAVSRSFNAEGLVVKSLTQHWSAGLVGNAFASTYRNYDMRLRIAPGLEYNFFPYSESTRRMLTLNYTVGLDSHEYREVTIYDKLREKLIDHRLGTTLSMRQPWGTSSGSVEFSQYLTQPTKYSLSAYASANVRLFKGFSFNVFTDLSRTRDQIYLPRGEATTEEILVRQRQLATGYYYYVNFGVSYSFGSIFNNVVNPRFGGGGNFF